MTTDSSQAWAGDLLDGVLVRWRQHADTPDGLFNPYLDRYWRHHEDGPRTLVSQCRLIYNFARAFERSRDPGYAELAQRGLAALERAFRVRGTEGWAWSCSAEGVVQDDTYDAYGHAFVILALATAAAVFREPRHRDLAMETWDFMQRRFRDDHGGLVWHVDRRGRTRDEPRSQNPMMHTYEALLALDAAGEDPAARDGARHIWRFLEARMPVAGCLPEWYDADWRPASEGDRAIVEVGHVFEWAFLLSEAQALFPEDDLVGTGRQLLAFGMEHGYDREVGGIWSRVAYDGRLVERRKGWWEQCEAIRALQRYVRRHGAAELAGPLRQSIAFVRGTFVDEEYGGWIEAPPGTGGEPSYAKGHAYKLDYHVVNLCRELLDT